MPDLFGNLQPPASEEPPAAASSESGFKPSVAWDWDNGDFVIDGANRLVPSDGHAAWKDWCIKTIHTHRGDHWAYSNLIGVDIREAFIDSSRPFIESCLRRNIAMALESDPGRRTNLVDQFEFLWEADSLKVSFTVTAKDGYTTSLSVNFPQGGE